MVHLCLLFRRDLDVRWNGRSLIVARPCREQPHRSGFHDRDTLEPGELGRTA